MSSDSDAGFSIADVPALGHSGALDAWEAPGDVCPEGLSVVIDPDHDELGEPVFHWLRCEVDGPHEEHEAVLRWKANDDGTGNG